MRIPCTFLALIIAHAISAQLVNGSFENNGAFSYTGWEFVCSPPLGVHDAPPGGGEWSASKEIGNVKGCWPSYLYQQIPFAQFGEIWTVSAWTRSDTLGITANASIRFGNLSNGIISLQEGSYYSGYEWTFVSITDTIIAGPNDFPLVVLDPGISAGPTFGAAWFDNVQLSIAEALPAPLAYLHTYMDEASSTLYLAAEGRTVRDVKLYDATGRALPCLFHHTDQGAAIAASALGAGVYIVRANTDDGVGTVRFVRR